MKSVCTTVVRGEEVEELHPDTSLPSNTQPWWTRRCGCSQEGNTPSRRAEDMGLPPAQRPSVTRGAFGLTPVLSLSLFRSGLLPVHGHALPWLCALEEGEVPGQARARIHPQLQGAASSFQEDGCRQSRCLRSEGPPRSSVTPGKKMARSRGRWGPSSSDAALHPLPLQGACSPSSRLSGKPHNI